MNLRPEGKAEQSEKRRPMSTEEQDRAMAMALQQQLNMEAGGGDGQQFQAPFAGVQTITAPANMLGKLTVTIVEARLAKNYGMTRMDPYCRVRVGHSVYETPTSANGSKEPKWNKTFTCYLLQGIKNLDVEIYDECTFQQDALIAYGTFNLSESVVVKKNEVADEWFALSGNEGAGKEGMIHIILSLQPIRPGAPMTVPPTARVVPSASAGHQPMVYTPQQQQVKQQQQPQQPPRLNDEELEELAKMFPNLDKEIIASVHASTGSGSREQTINQLLELGQE